MIERTGTMIVDSTPRGAEVLLDGNSTGESTAVTLQEVPPGPHTIEVHRDGYFPWKKTLDVKGEQVTFANAIWLVRAEDPQFRFNLPVVAMEADNNRNTLAMLGLHPISEESVATSTLALTVWSETSNLQTTEALEYHGELDQVRLEYRDNGESLLVGGDHLNDDALWFSLQGNTLSQEVLPPGKYFWNGENLQGLNKTHRIIWNAQDQTLSQERITGAVIQSFEPFTLLTPTGTTQLALRHEDRPNTLFTLPSADWSFAGQRGEYTLLNRDGSWLSIRPEEDRLDSKEAFGQQPIWQPQTETRGIMINGNELFIWDLETGTEVIWRRSDKLVDAEWHRSGELVLLATEQEVLALDLDPRDGRLVYQLSRFDRVYDIELLNQELYIAAERDGRHGVFVQRIE